VLSTDILMCSLVLFTSTYNSYDTWTKESYFCLHICYSWLTIAQYLRE